LIGFRVPVEFFLLFGRILIRFRVPICLIFLFGKILIGFRVTIWLIFFIWEYYDRVWGSFGVGGFTRGVS